MKIKITIEVDIEDSFNLEDEEEKLWFENEIMVGNGSLTIHSDEIGDIIGTVKKISNICYQ